MQKEFKINDRKLGDGFPAYIVAEIGINHNGDMDLAKKMIAAAAQAGVDAVKFQKRTPEICVPPEQRGQVLGLQGMMTYLGSTVGPILGGVLTIVSWRLNFFFSVPIGALTEALWNEGLSLPNQGDIDKQAIAGALATATHGTGHSLGALSTFAEAYRLVLADGSVAEWRYDQISPNVGAAYLLNNAAGFVKRAGETSNPGYLDQALEDLRGQVLGEGIIVAAVADVVIDPGVKQVVKRGEGLWVVAGLQCQLVDVHCGSAGVLV